MFQIHLRPRLLPAAAIALFAGAALAQQPVPPASDAPVLKGPQVQDGGIPGMRRPFGDGQGGDPKQRLADRPVPQREFMRALDSLHDENTPENLRLTDEQQEKIRAVNEDFQKAVLDFRQQHRAEIAELRKSAPNSPNSPAPGAAPGPADPDKMTDADAPQRPPQPPPEGTPARQKFEELRALAPNPKDYQARIFAVLTEAQRPIVEKNLQHIRQELGDAAYANRAKQEVHRQLQKGRAQLDAIANGGPVDLSKLPPRLRERLEAMTPEEREEAIKKFRERYANRAPGAAAGEAPDSAPSTQGAPARAARNAMPADLQETWSSLSPEERRALVQRARELAAQRSGAANTTPPAPAPPSPPPAN
jgi:DNA-binding MarR family transcriptional regulator